MRCRLEGGVLELVQGDITLQQVDAIVNAANKWLNPGGGVDAAIHRRGGPAIVEETRRRYPDGCPTGQAVVTGAGDLPSRFVIHAVGPRWKGGTGNESALLASAYRCCLELAAAHECRSIAFPSLSTGAYRYPVSRAARIAVSTVVDFLEDRRAPELVRFVLFDEVTFRAYAGALGGNARISGSGRSRGPRSSE